MGVLFEKISSSYNRGMPSVNCGQQQMIFVWDRNLFSVPSSANLATAWPYERSSRKTKNWKTFICWLIQTVSTDSYWIIVQNCFSVVILHRRLQGQECGKTIAGEGNVLETNKKMEGLHREKGYLKETGKDGRGVLVLNTVKGCIVLSCFFHHHWLWVSAAQQTRGKKKSSFYYFVSVSLFASLSFSPSFSDSTSFKPFFIKRRERSC